MRFQPKTDTELASENLLKDGVYDFEIVEASDTRSKAGNEMITLRLKVYDADGGNVTVLDYLLEAVLYKIAHLAKAVGLERSYNDGVLTAADLEGRAAKVKIATDPAKGNYAAKNVVKDYLPMSSAAPARGRSPLRPPPAPAMAAAGDLDDSIPF